MDDDDDDCLAYWRRNRVNLNKLVYPAIRALSVPAASLAVERVFSHGCVILRPHRGRMSNLVFEMQQIASTILSTDQQIRLVVFHHTLCLKFIGSNSGTID